MSYDNFRSLSINTVEKLDELTHKENGSIIYLVSALDGYSYIRSFMVDENYRTFPEDTFLDVPVSISLTVASNFRTVFFKARVLLYDNSPAFKRNGSEYIISCYARDFGIGSYIDSRNLTFDDINLAKAYESFCKKKK